MRTPMHPRTYLNMQQLVHQSPNHPGGRTPNMIHDTNSLVSEEGGVIFGTNISTAKVFKEIERFINSYEATRMEGEDAVNELIYQQKFNDVGLDLIGDIFEVKAVHLREFDQELYYQFIYFPAEMISCFDHVLKNMYERHYIDNEMDEQIVQERHAKKDRLMLGITGLSDEDIVNMRSLSPKEINRLICFRGIVIRCSEIFPEMKSATFRCTNCRNEVQVFLENAKVQEPTDCSRCKIKHSLELVHNLCTFTDKQFIKFQELPDGVPDGDTPSSMTILAYDNNVDGMRPGDRVEIVGIYRTQGQKVKRGRNALKAVFNTYVDLISFRVIQEDRFQAALGDKGMVFNDDDRRRFM